MTQAPPRIPTLQAEQCEIISTDHNLSAVSESKLTAAAIRQQLQSPPNWKPEVTDESRMALIKQRHAQKPPTLAAVLIPLVQREEGLTVLFTQRTAHLNDHAGQISFPGGRSEESDHDAIATALRETKEEISLDAQHIEVLGCLPDYFTVTSYRVVPVVALVTPPFTVQADPFEVAEIFEVPLVFLMNPANHERRSYHWQNVERQFFAMPYPKALLKNSPQSQQITDNEHYFIWGATAGMLRNLYHLLAA